MVRKLAHQCPNLRIKRKKVEKRYNKNGELRMNFEMSMQRIKQIKTTKFKEKYRSKDSAFIRRRKLSFENCIVILLNKKARSVQTEIDEYFKQKGKESVSRQSFAKVRENINPQAILDINKSIIEDFEKQNREKKLYKNHRTFNIDGSYISLPNSRLADLYFL